MQIFVWTVHVSLFTAPPLYTVSAGQQRIIDFFTVSSRVRIGCIGFSDRSGCVDRPGSWSPGRRCRLCYTPSSRHRGLFSPDETDPTMQPQTRRISPLDILVLPTWAIHITKQQVYSVPLLTHNIATISLRYFVWWQKGHRDCKTYLCKKFKLFT